MAIVTPPFASEQLRRRLWRGTRHVDDFVEAVEREGQREAGRIAGMGVALAQAAGWTAEPLLVRCYGGEGLQLTELTRKADAQMDFDFAKVVEASKDNPVFYVQYAHARIASLMRKAAAAGLERAPAKADLARLEPDELALVALAAQFPRTIEGAALAHEPHRLAYYLGDLAAAFHALWNKGNDEPEKRFLLAQYPELTRARLELAAAIGQVLRNGLAIMGVAAVEEML